MTDDTSRSGYDDILSSVRRIVSTEIDTAADQEAGKLLLTPALRVAEPEEATKPDLASRGYPTLEERIADLEEAVGSDAADWEPDGSEDQDQHKPSSVVLPLRPDADEPDSEAIRLKSEPEASPPPDLSDHADRDTEIGRLTDEATAEEPIVPAELATFRHRGARPIAETSDDDLLAEEEPTLLDEAGLRDLVAEIVREELQGGLGERITRNVRKLVRAEIQRAFAARDLD